MSRRINPFTDAGFKRIFGQEPRKEFLIDFLNSLLQGERVITDLQYLDKEQVKQTVGERSLIYDVYCETNDGERIIVEMQNGYQKHYKSRSIYYLARAIDEQGQSGDWRYELSAVYCISLLNHEAEHMEPKFRTDIGLMDMETGQCFSDKARLIYLQLPYFTKTEEECVTNFDKWIYVLKNMEGSIQLPFALQSPLFKKLEQVTDLDSLSKEERREYDHALKQYRDTVCGFIGAVEHGEKIGLEKGRKEGRKERNFEIARNLKSMGVPVETIRQATGLSDEELDAL